MTIDDVRKHPWVRAGGTATGPKVVGPPASALGAAAAPPIVGQGARPPQPQP